jgi:predicted RNase H-like nuclease (RuvC/YqgF family)
VEIGVIAQQVEPIVPELVHTADDERQTKSVNYIGFIGYIIGAIQELSESVMARLTDQEREISSTQATNREQTGRIDRLEEENHQLKQKNKNLEERLKRLEELLLKHD